MKNKIIQKEKLQDKTDFYTYDFFEIGNKLPNLREKCTKISKGQKLKIKNMKQFRNNLSLIILLISINIFIPKYSHIKFNKIELNNSKITLKIKGIGSKNILFANNNPKYSECSFGETYYPDEIYINGDRHNIISNNYYLNQTDNNIILIWNTPINYCECIFCGCSDITEIDLSFFDSSQVTNMFRMFRDCISLTSINLSNFDTSQVTTMRSMFLGCLLLTSLNLTNFDTSKVRLMHHMFRNCTSLTSLNLSNFDTSKVTYMNNMFDGCINLKYINLKNFDENGLTLHDNMFDLIPDNIVICLNQQNTKNIILPKLKDKKCYSIDCSDNWQLNQIKLVNRSYTCIDDYGNDEVNIFYSCPNINIKNICNKCNSNFYPKEDNLSTNDSNTNCYKNPKGYYLDNNDSIYKKCYFSCESCSIKGNNVTHNCLSCNLNFSFEIKNNDNYKNCYTECKYYYYFDNESNYHCTNDSFCPEDYPKLIQNKSECIKDYFKVPISSDIFVDEFFNKSSQIIYEEKISDSNPLITEEYIYETSHIIIQQYSNKLSEILYEETSRQINNTDHYKIKDTNTETKYISIETNQIDIINNIQDIIMQMINNKNQTELKEKNINIYDKINEKIELIFTSESYNTSKIDDGNEEIIITEKMNITLTTTNNQKNNKNNNITYIDFENCENLLREHYNISHEQLLYMKKIDLIQEGMRIPKIEYDIYCKLNGINMEKLNLSVCEKTKVVLFLPVDIKENLDELNSSSGYFNDICYTSSSDYGTDITLTDRKKEFIEKIKTVCQEECTFSEYNFLDKIAKCSCDVKISSLSFDDININTTQLYKNFGNLKNYINLSILVCFNVLFSKMSILHNISFYEITIIMLFHLISTYIFYRRHYYLIRDTIEKIAYEIKNYKGKEAGKEEKGIQNNSNIINENINENKENYKISKNKKFNKKKKKRKKRKRPLIKIKFQLLKLIKISFVIIK